MGTSCRRAVPLGIPCHLASVCHLFGPGGTKGSAGKPVPGSLRTAWSLVFGVNRFTCTAAAYLRHPVSDVAAVRISNRLRIESGRGTVLQERPRNQPLETSK